MNHMQCRATQHSRCSNSIQQNVGSKQELYVDYLAQTGGDKH